MSGGSVPRQARHLPEDSVHGRDQANRTEKKGQVRQFGGAAAAGADGRARWAPEISVQIKSNGIDRYDRAADWRTTV